MRLNPAELAIIRTNALLYLGEGVKVWLFGSRVNDQKKGGDVDLYLEAAAHPLMQEIRCKRVLEEQLDMPVDLIVRSYQDDSPIAQIAKRTGVAL